MAFAQVFGVDFSGARLAGRTTWVARLTPGEAGALALDELASVERLCGTGERGPALAYLVGRIAASRSALWALDFRFAFPLEVMTPGGDWGDQFAFLAGWGEDAYGAGLECLRRARDLGGPGHLRRHTDVIEAAPFDPYHYRAIYQTFYGMRDVLGPLRGTPRTAILPFEYRRLRGATRVVVEACPGGTLRSLGAPHHNYKQPGGGPLTPKRRRSRREVLARLTGHVAIGPADRRRIQRDGGGDALDAVVAAVGAWRAWGRVDHAEVRRHPRYPREGRHYA